MRSAIVLFLVAMSLCLTPAAFGQRALDQTEIQGVIKQLTSLPRDTWISAGTIQATHYEEGGPKTTDPAVIQAEIEKAVHACQQSINASPLPDTVAENPQKLELEATEFNVRYDLENKYTMTSNEIVKYDGQRFLWEMTVTSRSDSMAMDSDLAGNYMVRHYAEHAAWNQHRIAAWDGQEYTTYFASGGQATVDATGTKPHVVNGPLKAGLIPWGNGKFSAANLSAAEVSAEETSLDKTTCIQMTISHTDGSTTEVVLDPSKDYAVTSATFTASGIVVTYTCSDYQSVAGRWIPATVVIERKVDSIKNRMPTIELWTNIKVVSTSTPSLSSFEVPLALDATVEYASPATTSPVSYLHSYEVDTEKLLAERLAYGAAEGRLPQNCATIALQHVASGFGKSVSSAALASLVGTNGRTSLHDLKQSARKLGLYASVATADLATLRTLGTTKAILHLPAKNHFVVLDRVDDQFVWLVDLSSKNFYYRVNVHLFPMDWSAGTALLISDQPLARQLPELSDVAAKEIAAGWWTCNTLYQEWHFTGCESEWYVYCEGYLTYYYERWVCGWVESGTCPTSVKVRYEESPCVLDPVVWCQITGMWTAYVMRACL
ncbi:MAG: cysteine peptidase family C39 domain-containing protein [Phycisphaerales bacterium]